MSLRDSRPAPSWLSRCCSAFTRTSRWQKPFLTAWATARPMMKRARRTTATWCRGTQAPLGLNQGQADRIATEGHADGTLTAVLGFADAVPVEGEHKHWTTRCIVSAIRSEKEWLSMDPGDYSRRYGRRPVAALDTATIDALLWHIRMMEILVTGGGELLSAARTAHDEQLGRPRRRRATVDAEWLAGEIDTALSAVWSALAGAQHDGMPLWDLPSSRPRAGDAVTRGVT